MSEEGSMGDEEKSASSRGNAPEQDVPKQDAPKQDAQQLAEDIRGELGQMNIVAEELEAIADDVGDGPVTLRDRAAASAFLASFYMGVENVLKRIARFHGVDLPRSERWHVELFEQFCAPEPDTLQADTAPQSRSFPVLFDGELIRKMDAYRRFRHVIHHGYERDLDYDKMRPGIEGVRSALEAFREEVEQYLSAIER
jgi:hypothetical protein